MSSYPQPCHALAPPPDPRPLLASKRLPELLTIGRFQNNDRRDNLEGAFWKNVFGFSHGLVIANAFYEHVDRPGQDGKPQDVVLEFLPNTGREMLVACLWSRWTPPVGSDEPALLSFAAVTDEPPPEVAAAGHDRCVIPIKAEHVDAWLNPDRSNLAEQYAILDDRERPYYEHRLAA